MAYRVNIKRSARKAIDRILQKKARQRVEDRIVALADDPRPADSRQLQGELSVYRRLREGSYRIVYEVRDEELVVLVVLVAQREGVYDTLRRMS
ncbi:MAG: type II toxin-antitoxin system RelE/ParE family toxin [Actinomycetota bacterium]|nr:type II toxin-antitoxin system RelE/ParE family toxin [Actinomycetota bacterium]